MGFSNYDKDDTVVKGLDKSDVDEKIRSYKQQLKTADILDCAATYGELTVGTTPVEVKVGGTILADRKCLHMQPKHDNIYWGYDNSVTTTTGTRMFKNQFIAIDAGEDVSVWVVANVAGRKLSIGELS